jgi:chaperonin GroES
MELQGKKLTLDKILQSDNVAKELSEDQLNEIGSLVFEGFQEDLKSRDIWEKDIEKWTKLALQISDRKSYPWDGASNVKYPLLATAAMQFAARAYPSLVPSDGKLVKCAVKFDPTGQLQEQAKQIAEDMSNEFVLGMENWEEDMDKALLILPIIGDVFKKTYWDSNKRKYCSKLILPANFVINYWATSIEEADRYSEWYYLSPRKVKEKQLRGSWLNVDLGEPSVLNLNETSPRRDGMQAPSFDETTPYKIIEQHTFLDLDGDEYSEPYVVYIEANSKKVLRIAPNFTDKEVTVDEEGTIVTIDKLEYYTKIPFVPSPDGGFYDIGFGRLLGSINASADSIINQLIDAGSMSNLQAGFLGKGLRLKMGDSKFKPGEWKVVNATGDDIKKQILPLPIQPPSPVLLELLKFLLQSGKELASIAEIFVGKMPGQNTPATTTQATIEQGMKIFTAVYKRIFRGLTEEYRKLYKMKQLYGTPEEQDLYSLDHKTIWPAADPAATSAQEKATKAGQLLQLLPLGTLDPIQVTSFALDAWEIPNKENFMIQQPQGNPEAEMKQQEMQMKQQESQLKAQLAMAQAQHKIKIEEIKAKIKLAEAQQKMELERQAKEMDMQYKQVEAILKAQIARANHEQSMREQSDNHQINMATQIDNHRQSMQMDKERSKQKGNQSTK